MSESLLTELAWPAAWSEYLAYKTEKGHLSRKELDSLSVFIAAKEYLPCVQAILRGEPLSLPEKRFVNKGGSGRKRAVYRFRPDEMAVLKLLTFLLYRYDDRMPDGCYSFRPGAGAHTAIRKITGTPGVRGMWCAKVDVADYFNSIDVAALLPELAAVFSDDPPLYEFFARYLGEARAVFEGEIITEPHGVMAGTPVSPFLANLYLADVDRAFAARGILYARYSDDILFFAQSEAQLTAHMDFLRAQLAAKGLSVNQAKTRISAPGEAWEYLGFEYKDGQIDLSHATREKIKARIRRKARALYRWQTRKGAAPERTLRAMNRAFNRKFYGGAEKHGLTWSRWFFPILTQADGLREVDGYLQQYLRYLPTGRHTKKNGALRYDDLRAAGYRPLVAAYYEYRQAALLSDS
ncbi:MAG: hypothetical protein LBR14_02480 [Clostridiales Family XIII bacterium]|jgi:hypothetical protein|nr:hypothetical protein [Clostridiales Family XIII bacterium]